jgi:uncharacterized protein YdbL (DUF1318 family)
MTIKGDKMKKLLYLVIFGVSLSFLGFHPGAVSADTYNIKVMTPQINRALDSRRERFEKLQKSKKKIAIGENNRGYVEALKKDDATVKMVQEENKDRKVIYQAIADQNDLSDAIGIIEEVFAEVQRNKAESGHKYQTVTGEWVSK